MRKKGFTLIELLVVIAIIALLMAILLPTLRRVRRQAKAVACQSNLRQWGTILSTVVAEHDGYFPGWGPDDRPPTDWRDFPGWTGWWCWNWGWYGPYGYRDWYNQTEAIRCCPMATKPASSDGGGSTWGGTFMAWGRLFPKYFWPSEIAWAWEKNSYGSYGSNYRPRWDGGWLRDQPGSWRWTTPYVKGANNIPLHMDSCLQEAWFWPGESMPLPAEGPPPPECDAVPTMLVRQDWRHTACINRHDGYVNSLFMDWSVRKVGLKELWTLKWNREYDTQNCWTKAGGVRPEDWPPWMRKFKDY